ncbi:uncharacterized protein LOC128260623 [Drosophila gunungcola]|uniref:uncharacterized protein LOC128260623 n=1 Tax=Drosophila gunungcola TaxID=103775 RepID=UPI0022E3B595|nr:uncharacterized protein LOC128260623 [Drosophila gunungcola]XP_052849728.1 uncharacterized protein LOC128260623 [Drosophila gunungcola]XP_052849729.1 uncharacterized protein LOC128260623 [Drosophila gunungcola]XP_052849730.1 uncharacterized protein LOC128260623 [Drosophila gunungcola]
MVTMSLTSTSTEAATAAATLGNATVGEMFSDADMAEVRHVVQRILVPCVFVIGLLGNSVSIYVLTRKRMRCTTNIYLTALAITDIAYLTCQLILSLQHYDYPKYHLEIYYQLYGYFVWLCDSFGYISIYIAVCFTIERFIAIRYPLKRQTFCTESLAKKVIAAVAVFCLLSTLSTAFEHTITVGWKLIDDAYQPCNQTVANFSPTPPIPSFAVATPPLATPPLPTPATISQHFSTEASTAGSSNLLVDWGSGSGDGEPENIPRQRRHWQSSGFVTLPNLRQTLEEQDQDEAVEEPGSRVTESMLQLLRRKRNNNDNSNNNNNNNNNNNTDAFAFNVTEYCQNVTIYNHGTSELGKDELYSNLWNMFTLLVFVVFPLLLLATFNSFLILLVHRSKSLRGDLTNASSIRRTKRKSNSGIKGSVSQENRVTITLIAVVLMFIFCQLPWAIYLILSQYMDFQIGTQVVAGNVCNLLASLHAASNFFLYCVLSDKYRKTVRELITGYRYRRRHARNNTSLYVPHTTTTLTQINGDHYGSNYGGAGSRRSRNTSRLIT